LPIKILKLYAAFSKRKMRAIVKLSENGAEKQAKQAKK